MLPMKRGFILFKAFFLPVICSAQFSNGVQILKKPAAAPNIAAIGANSITVVTGTTYRFTVDTPEDSGLVSTNPGVTGLLAQLAAAADPSLRFSITNSEGKEKTDNELLNGDLLHIRRTAGKTYPKYQVEVKQLALNGRLTLNRSKIMANTQTDLTLRFTAGQRSPNATVKIYIPSGVKFSTGRIRINVIGRGFVNIQDLPKQSIGRTGSKYSYSKVGTASFEAANAGGTWLTLSGLDLRPANGDDIVLVISNAVVAPGDHEFKANYSTSAPAIYNSAGGASETAKIAGVNAVADFERVPYHATTYHDATETYRQLYFRWSANPSLKNLRVQQSTDQGKTWTVAKADLETAAGSAQLGSLKPNQLYTFRLQYSDGKVLKTSNSVSYFSGRIAASAFGINGNDKEDYTDRINVAIDSIHRMGGGTLYFGEGNYHVRTIHLKSNVYLFVGKLATIIALKGGDAPETTWFSDKKYRSGLSPTDPGPYADPENYMTKQDVGHHYFRNTMFFAEREDNIKIIGNGRITGNGNLVTGDRVMNNAADNRSDKMFTFKLCTNIEIGGLLREEDLWYDEKRDEPYYMLPNGQQDTALGNMLHIDQGGHFVLLATGTDNINVHDTYFGKSNGRNARDIYDFMACNNILVTNIYSKLSSDDIVKPGSDCSLGFTRPARNYKVRNVIGDTNCNLFQVGSETADDIQDICVDNIYILGANKAGFSISTNDGAYIKNIHLNCGHTGKLHSRSKMLRSFTPFFISISNRARILGAEAGKYAFTENGEKHNELLIKNVNIGQVENIILNGIDISEVYGGSSHGGSRWKAYDGKQRRATPIVAGYSLPDAAVVEGGLDFRLPNGKHTGYIKNIVFNDVHVLVKGTNPVTDTSAAPPELGVGQYNASNLRIQPSYGLWARHAADLKVTNCSFNFEETDQRYVIFLDDVKGAVISGNEMVRSKENPAVIGMKNATGVVQEKNKVYEEEWKNKTLPLSGSRPKQPAAIEPPPETGQKQ